ncbi:MAG: glyoxalase [Alphaproteobacteria bacterium]|nr:glyoxalase [Alphaproteobacteria bacterium]
MTFHITAFDHVNVAVPRAREAEVLRFYREVLGLLEIPKPVELRSRGGAWFEAGNAQIHVSLEDLEVPQSRRHFCILVDNLDAARHAMKRHHVAIEEGGTAEGLTRFFIRDPVGNRIEIGYR